MLTMLNYGEMLFYLNYICLWSNANELMDRCGIQAHVCV